MKKFLILILFSGLLNTSPVYIVGNNYKGFIFPKEYKNEYFIQDSITSFTPSIEEVDTAEGILRQKIKVENNRRINQGGKCPVLHKKLSKYNRQYFGFLDKNGNKIIYINLIWGKSTPSYWDKDIVIVFDGCSYYWNVKVNLENEEIYDLRINGSS
jgi:hypothetical protein